MSFQIDELACLPEISPTTIYLEIAEGRNISLLCKITAVPEASITWWFQGQILQNDTIIAPNLHLYYYIEEGVDEKRSELFIFNANADDNGTFACVAENSAGRSQANYTIRVIVKEEPVVEEVSFPNEIFLFIIGAATVICLLTLVCCSIIICKCRSQTQSSSSNKKKKKKRSKGKEVSFQLPNSQKCVAIANDINACSKINGNLTITDNNQQDMLLYLSNNTANISINDMSLQGLADRNPDLINDAESLRQRNEHDMKQNQRDDGEMMEKNRKQTDNANAPNENNFSLVPILRPIPARFTAMSTLPRGVGIGANSRDMYQVDVHLNPGCFIDTNGYPIEYSLAQVPVVNQAPVNYNYQTLPHNRAAGGKSVVRFANEAEFITRTSQTFQTYSPDVRYTAEGYPCDPSNGGGSLDLQNFPSPPEGYKTDNTSSLPTVALLNNQNFCPNSLVMQQQAVPKWPSCLPGYHPQLIAIDTQNVRFQMSPQSLQSPTSQSSISVTKKCVGAQTNDLDNNVIHEEEEEDEEDEGDGEADCSNNKCRQLKGPLADSPDEGYVGDSQESSDI